MSELRFGPPPPPTSISPNPYATANMGQVVAPGPQRPAMGNGPPPVETRTSSSVANDSPIRVFSNGSSEDVTFTPNGQTLQAHLVFENRGGKKQAIKPTSSLPRPQKTVTQAGEPTEIATRGRHDPCLLPRFVPMGEAMMALVLVDHWLRHKTTRLE